MRTTLPATVHSVVVAHWKIYWVVLAHSMIPTQTPASLNRLRFQNLEMAEMDLMTKKMMTHNMPQRLHTSESFRILSCIFLPRVLLDTIPQRACQVSLQSQWARQVNAHRTIA